MDPVSIIALVVSGVMAIVGIATFVVNLGGATRGHDGDVHERAYHEGKVDQTLVQIERNTSQTVQDVKDLDFKLDEFNGRLVRVEQRVDGHDSQIDDLYDLLGNDVDPKRADRREGQ